MKIRMLARTVLHVCLVEMEGCSANVQSATMESTVRISFLVSENGPYM